MADQDHQGNEGSLHVGHPSNVHILILPPGYQ
ncbi:uncharacterized protein METZ01_LOCUS494053 [marine metagenome]|uniref:Uncharacterized protein n=1 Tax=marine metagenome TaxID=408172 RepID=A0A383DA58_9ZZZZ